MLRGRRILRVAFPNLRMEMRHSRRVLYGFDQVIWLYNFRVIGHDRLAVLEGDLRSLDTFD